MISCPEGQVFHGWTIAHRLFLLHCHNPEIEHTLFHAKSMNFLFLLSACLLIFLILVGAISSFIVLREYYNAKKEKAARLTQLKRRLSIIQEV